MSEFIRARSSEQKAQRMAEIKAAAERQFAGHSYHEITLATIAGELGWSRANLYKYASTKEEVFLSLTADKRDSYLNALLSALPQDCGFSTDTIAEVWAGIANAHRDFFRFGDLLFTIMETNVSVEKLTDFKRGYYQMVDTMQPQLSCVLGIHPSRIEALVNSIYHHGVGTCCLCTDNPLVFEAVTRLGITPEPLDFKAEMRDFIAMSLSWYAEHYPAV